MDPRDASASKKRRYDIFIFLILNNHVRNDLYLSESRSKVAHFLFAFALKMKNILLLLIKKNYRSIILWSTRRLVQVRNLLDVPEKLNEGASQRASTHLTSRITFRSFKISLDESLLKIFNWWWPDVERTGKSDDLQPRLARTVSDDKPAPPEYSMSLLTSIMSCFEKPILSNIKTEGRVTRLLQRQGEQTNPSWCQLIYEAVFSVEVHVQVLGAPETRLQEVDMVLGGENDNGLKNHLHKKFKPPESEGGVWHPLGVPHRTNLLVF